MRFVCIRKCFHLNRLWEPGMILESDVTAPRHFVPESQGQTPPGVKKRGRPAKGDVLADHTPPAMKPAPVGLGDLGQ